ncbi:HPr(Ser) kinase/phosphatase [Basilea psittacipulmonis]|uniref:HPr(Ser) kinase/phosphatase n=1 Tax=Basilea psittacipulmonis TaxID=1472345 RepID=UPI00068A9E76|nr:HPr(Ser) kinase/phosphatase [Basilea psittacipulmonis]
MLSIQKLVNENSRIQFQWIAGEEAAKSRYIKSEDMVSSSAELVGHLNNVHPRRIQVFGVEEMAFFERLPERSQNKILVHFAEGNVFAIIVGNGQALPDNLIKFCIDAQIPLLSTTEDAAHIIEVLRIYLSRRFAPKTTVHGVFMDVFGLGVLITGESGLGKSELALELISRGHGLVADDAVEFSRNTPNDIDGKCPELLRNLLEVRGLGLLDIKTIFGETSVRRKMRLKLIVHLVKTSSDERLERLPIQSNTQDILGVPILKVNLQVAAGRNLAVLVEAAVRNTILKLRGIDTLAEFMERQSRAIMESTEQADVLSQKEFADEDEHE